MDTLKRNTKSKQLVLNLLQDSQTAISHEYMEKMLKGKMDRVTVYRILQGFRDDGIVHKFVNNEGKSYYALCHHCTSGHHHDNHPHFHCLKCDEVTCMEGYTENQTLSQNFVITSIQSFISGYCPKCSKTVKALFLLLFFTASQFAAISQTKISVLDKSDNTPVIYANVYFPDTKTGTLTDSLGQFVLPQTIGTVLVQISAMGYQTLLLQANQADVSKVVYLLPSVHELQEIVVSTNSSRLQGENVMNVEKVNLKSAEIQGVSLSEKLASVPGLSNYSTGAGIGKPVIRGLSGNRIAVFSQGVRVENQQWGDEHGLGLDDNGYEQVEIIKGPASLLYGSDALGGVLYFSEERFAKQNMLEAALNSEYNSNTNGFRNNAAFKMSKKQWHVNLFGGYTTHEDYTDGNNNRIPNSRFNTTNFKTVLGYSGKKYTALLKYSFLQENYGLTEPDEAGEDYSNNRKPFSPYQNLATHMLGSENTVYFENDSRLKIDLGYVFNNRKEIEDNEAALNMNLNTISYNIKWLSARIAEHWEFTTGSQGMYQQNKNFGKEMLIPDATTSDLGVFGVSNYYFSKKSFWQTGVRFDSKYIHSDDFSEPFFAFNFSTGIFQPITERLSFRANLSSGFRAPNMYELLSDGVHEGTNRYEKGNRELKTENSYQIDATFNYSSKHLELFLNPYFNYIRNFIYVQTNGSEIDGVPVYDYLQNDAFLYGGEAGFHFHPHPLDWLHLESSYSNTFGKQQSGDYLPLMPSQKIKSTLSANLTGNTFLSKYSAYFQHLYSFAQHQVSEYETVTPSYNLLNAGFAFEFQFNRQPFLLNFAVNNLLDEKYYDHLSRYKPEGIFNMGRNFTIKLSVPLAFKLNME